MTDDHDEAQRLLRDLSPDGPEPLMESMLRERLFIRREGRACVDGFTSSMARPLYASSRS
jgi:hypothetical protein